MESKILLQDLAQGVSERSSVQKKDSDNFVRNVFDVIVQYLQEDKIVKVKGLGTFKVIEVSGRDSVNVNTGERIHIDGHSKISFTPDASLRDQVNRPFADFETIVINDGIDIAEMERIPSREEESEDAEDLSESRSEDAGSVVTPDQIAPIMVEDAVAASKTDVEDMAANAIPVPSTNSDNVGEADASFSGEQVVQDEPTGEEQPNVPEPEADSLLDIPATDEATAEGDPAIGTEGIAYNDDKESAPEMMDENALSKESEDKEETAVKEKVVYVQNKSCWFCRICFVLLTLCLMALSYLSGYQRWFCQADQTESNHIHVEERTPHVTVPPSGTIAQSDSTQSAESAMISNSSSLPSDSNINAVASQATAAEEMNVKMEASLQSSDVHGQTSSQIANPVQGTDSPQSSAKVQTPSSVTSGKAQDQEHRHTSSRHADKERKSDAVKTPGSLQSNVAKTQGSGRYKIVGTRCSHVVRAGEGLYRLARIYYNDMNMATYIAQYNHIADPNLISEGTILRIPELKKE